MITGCAARASRAAAAADLSRIGGRLGRQVGGGGIERRPAVGPDRPAQRRAVEDHADRAALAGQRVLDRELGDVHRLHRRVGHGGVLGDAVQRLSGVERAIVAGAALIGRMLSVRCLIGEIGQQQHRRAAQVRLQRSQQRVGQHERPLPDRDPGLAGEAAVHLGHHARQLLVPHQYRPHRRLVIVQRVVDRPGIAANDPEHHVDAGTLQRLHDPLDRTNFFL